MNVGSVRSGIARLFAWLRSADGLSCLALLLIALAVRLYFAPKLMTTGDMLTYEAWGEEINANFWHIYSAYSTNALSTTSWFAVPVYGPVALYLFGLVTKIYFGVGALLGISLSHSVVASSGLKLALKLPAIVADEIFIAILFVKASKALPRWAAWLATLTYALSPGILITVLWFGQTDGIIALFVVLGLLMVLQRRPVWAGVFFALAVSFKPTPAIFLPLALLYLLRNGGLKPAIRGALAFVGVSVLVWLPYLLPPSFEVFAFLHNASQVNDFVGVIGSRDAGNLWYLLNLPLQNAGVPYFGPLSLNQVGELLFGLVVLIALIGVWFKASEEMLWAGAALIAYGFFTVMTLQFERYLYPALGLFFLAALFNRRYWVIYAITSVGYLINYEMSLFMYQAVNVSPAHQTMLLLHIDRWQLGLVNCCALVYGVFVYLRAMRQSEEVNPQPAFQRFEPSVESVLTPALAPALATAGVAYGVPATRPIIGGQSDLMSNLMQPDTMRMKALSHGAAAGSATSGKGGKGGKDSEEAHRPRLRLRPRALGRPPYVSVVIPCYNEQGNVLPMYERLTAALRPVTPSYELIFVNNGSYDHSPELFEELASRDQHVSVLTLSRNFGSQGAYSAGFAYASGDCVVGLDGDIQDPPELIPALLAKWQEGYDVVYGIRARRKGSLPRRIGYKLFYRLLRRLSYVDIPRDASDFGVMDRRVVNVLNEMPERSRLIRGLRAYAGFSQTGIPYERAERFSGFTTNSFLGLFRWASLGIVSFSFAPLDLISYLAGVVVALTGVAIVVYTALFFLVPGAPRGFQTLLVAVLFLGAVQLLCLSIIGTYLGKVFEEVKARPRYLVHDILNDHRRQV